MSYSEDELLFRIKDGIMRLISKESKLFDVIAESKSSGRRDDYGIMLYETQIATIHEEIRGWRAELAKLSWAWWRHSFVPLRMATFHRATF